MSPRVGGGYMGYIDIGALHAHTMILQSPDSVCDLQWSTRVQLYTVTSLCYVRQLQVLVRLLHWSLLCV